MTTSLATALPRVPDQDHVDRIIAEQGGRPGSLLSVLEKLQEQHRNKYLPIETLEYVAARTGVPQAQVYSVATFYALFNLEPQGLHTVSICRGTACHTRGSRALLERLKLQLGLRQQRHKLGLPEAAEASHMGHPDFRVGGKVFATLGYPDGRWGMVKLTPGQQEALLRTEPGVFTAVKGGWGLRGATNVRLAAARRRNLGPALVLAYRNVAPRRLVEALGTSLGRAKGRSIRAASSSASTPSPRRS